MELKIFITQRGCQSTEVCLECVPLKQKRHTFSLLMGNDLEMSCHKRRVPTDLHDHVTNAGPQHTDKDMKTRLFLIQLVHFSSQTLCRHRRGRLYI